MPTRRIHSIDRMIALHQGGHVLAIFPSSFEELVENLLPDLTQMERISFKSAASPVSLFLQREHVPNIPKWEDLFLRRLRDRIAEFGHLLTFTLEKREEIENFLPDILEGYRGNHIGEFAFSLDKVQGTNTSVVTLNAYDPPSAWQRLTKAERDPRQRVVLPVGEIARISGTSLEFEITTNGRGIRLTRNGSIIANGG